MNTLRADVVIAGGGPGGTMAAIAAARRGVKVLLLERYGFLGGMNTAGLVGPIMTFHAGDLQIVRGIADEMIQNLVKTGASTGHLLDPIWGTTSMTPVDPEALKVELFKMVAGSGAELLLHSFVMGGARDPSGRLKSLLVATKSGVLTVEGTVFIDATGDGDLAALMGCEFIHGRESDGLTQPMTLMFRMAGVCEEEVRAAIRKNPEDFSYSVPLDQALRSERLAVAGFFSVIRRARAEGKWPLDRDRILFFGLPREGEVTVNTLRISRVSGINVRDLTRAETELRARVPWLVDFLRERVPGFSRAHLVETAAQIGVRETRHVLGERVLTAQDIITRRRFEDVIAHASYPMDIHSPDGSGLRVIKPEAGEARPFYDIPLKCLIPRGTDGLLVTGRCISADHEASASARISATCMALGEAAGATAALAIKLGANQLSELSPRMIQSDLRARGAFLEI